jgi:hypothetical protein
MPLTCSEEALFRISISYRTGGLVPSTFPNEAHNKKAPCTARVQQSNSQALRTVLRRACRICTTAKIFIGGLIFFLVDATAQDAGSTKLSIRELHPNEVLVQSM